MAIYGILFSYTGCVGYESIDERMVLVIPKGAVAKDPRPAPGSVLPKDATDLKVKFFTEFDQKMTSFDPSQTSFCLVDTRE